MNRLIPCLVLAVVIAGSIPAFAQEPMPSKPAAQAPPAQVPLKVDLVVSRYAGEKRVSSVPFTLSVVANDNDKTSLRMGVDVPVPTTVFTPGGPNTSVPQTSFNYRSVGTNIDCSARSVAGGMFKLDIAVSDTSVFVPEKPGAATPNPVAGVPAFRSFTSSFNLLLKDGQSAQQTSATDPVSGEVLKIDVVMTVLR